MHLSDTTKTNQKHLSKNSYNQDRGKPLIINFNGIQVNVIIGFHRERSHLE